jgi:hypothetical protein
MDYRSMKFQDIINELQDIKVCSICGEGTHVDFMADTEGAADTSNEPMCDWCMGNGQ